MYKKDGGLRAWRWFVALLIGIFVYVGLHFSNEPVKQWIVRLVYSTEYMHELRELVLGEQSPLIAVNSQPITDFTVIKRQGNGFLVHFEEEVVFSAREKGVIVFTGHTAKMGKVITITYDDHITVTYGYMDDLYHLPYSAVTGGELIGRKAKGEVYIAIEQLGRAFTMQETIDWLHDD